MKIDYISDLHLDFHIPYSTNPQILYETTTLFLEHLLPETIGDVLVLAGDLSHYNQQSVIILTYFADIYKHVLFVLGNHDYYLHKEQQSLLYNHNSLNRVNELKKLLHYERNVHCLERFEVIQIMGKTFTGATNWYALQHYEEIHFFKKYSNDSALIKHFDIQQEHLLEQIEFKKITKVDVCITHVPPILIDSHKKYDSTFCFLQPFDLNAVTYIFGHCHEQKHYERAGWQFYINALGYPNEYLSKKVQSFSI